jgi:putative membrane protein
MKSKALLIIAFPVVMVACNNESKDAVETADSANKANIDTAINRNMPTIDEGSATFMVKAANGGMAEVDLAGLAQQKASSQQVKDFASMMITDHSGANDQLKALAAQKNVTLPAAPSDEKQKTKTDLSEKSGANFDKEYMKIMVKEHEETINLFEKAVNDAKDPDVSAFADKTLPKLREHLTKAKAVRDGLK